MNARPTVKAINKTILLRDYYSRMGDAFNSMLRAFEKRQREGKLSQEKLATLLGVNKGLISRRLKGAENLTLRTLSYMAKAMDCRLKVDFIPYEDKAIPNSRYSDLNNLAPATATNTAIPSFTAQTNQAYVS